MPADAVLFDLDSTLCVSERSDHEIHEAVFDRVDAEPFFSPADVRAVDSEDLPTAHSDRGFYENLYAAVTADVGRDPGEIPLGELAAATVEVVDETAVTFRDGGREALEYARERGPVGLVTNGGETNQRAKLEQLGIADAFDATVFCDPAAGVHPKPHPAPFRRALDGLNATPERSVYVGDSLGADVAGANDLGMTSVWVPFERPHEDLPADPDPEPTYLLDSPAELPDVL
jgi:putative hydrolase of the HAD superfamily